MEEDKRTTEAEKTDAAAGLNERLVMWFFSSAPYWKFWKPQSGFIGGLLFGAILLCLLEIMVWLST